mgnify:CR=1 FL=1
MKLFFVFLWWLLASTSVLATEVHDVKLDLTSQWVGYAAICIFVAAYILVSLEEQIQLRKSKHVLLAAGFIWVLIAIACNSNDMAHHVESAIRHNFLEYAERFFFLLVAMTYINAMLERGVFDALRNFLVGKGYSYKALFWLTGVLAFFISPVADNLTTALIMCAVVLAVGGGQPKFVGISCINIVVGANAGGAFSPFGDITTLMVWQKGLVEFNTFFLLFIPSAINFVLPALCMHAFIPEGTPPANGSPVAIRRGGIIIMFLFAATIATACRMFFHQLRNACYFFVSNLPVCAYEFRFVAESRHAQDQYPSKCASQNRSFAAATHPARPRRPRLQTNKPPRATVLAGVHAHPPCPHHDRPAGAA